MNLTDSPLDANNPPHPDSFDSPPRIITSDLFTAVDDDTAIIRIPVIEEQLQVSKRVIETGRVRLVKTVHEQTQTIQTPLQQEKVVVQRVPIDAYVTEMPPARQEGDTLIYPVVKEVVVVEKRLLLVEEIHVTRQRFEFIDEQTIHLRQEQITVERHKLSDERPV